MLPERTPNEKSALLAEQVIDSQRIEELFRAYYAPLCKMVNRMVTNPDAAEDIVQDVFVKIWNNRESLTITTSVKSYLYRAASNAALNYLEKNKRNVALEKTAFSEPAYSNTEDELYFTEVQAKVQEVLNILPPACKTIFVLSRYENLSNREIAESLQLSVKTVENQMGKALKHFREYLKTYTRNLFTFLL